MLITLGFPLEKALSPAPPAPSSRQGGLLYKPLWADKGFFFFLKEFIYSHLYASGVM